MVSTNKNISIQEFHELIGNIGVTIELNRTEVSHAHLFYLHMYLIMP